MLASRRAASPQGGSRLPEAPAFEDRWLAVRAAGALIAANLRFWPSIAPEVRRQLRRLEEEALRIPAPPFRRVALEKLRRESFNAEVAATVATLAPRERRGAVVRAIVALEVLYDYVDGILADPACQLASDRDALGIALRSAVAPAPAGTSARPLASPLGASTAPIESARAPARSGSTPSVRRRGEARCRPQRGANTLPDGGYASRLAETVRDAVGSLPAAERVGGALRAAAARTATAQLRSHETPLPGRWALEEWARERCRPSGLDWPEFAAGAAASVLSMHALIATAASRRTTEADAARLDRAYIAIAAVSTMLDSLNDYERDSRSGRPTAVDWYPAGTALAARTTALAREAIARAAHLRDGARHTMIAGGVIAYYTSPPEARNPLARPVSERLRRELRPLVAPSLAVLHAWRLAKRLAPSRPTLRLDVAGAPARVLSAGAREDSGRSLRAGPDAVRPAG